MSRAARLLDRVLLTTVRAVLEFVEDRGHRDAAQIGFFAVLSAIPLAMLLVGAFGLVLDEAEVRQRVITTAFDSVPVVQEAERERLERAVNDALDNVGRIGPISVLLLLVAATGVMGALRHSINVAWDIEARPSLLRRKAIDLALVTGATLLLLLSLSLSATRGAANRVDDISRGGAVLAFVLDAISEVLPFFFVAAVILFLYRVLPVERPRVREIWPGALVAAGGLFAVKGGLELYLEHLADFGALYGSLGALIALLLFVFAAANVLVFGAEFASEWARLPPDDEVRERVAGGRRREREAGLGVDVDLLDPVDLELDRVLDRDHGAVGRVDVVEERVESRGLAGAGGARGQHGAVDLADAPDEQLLVLRAHPELLRGRARRAPCPGCASRPIRRGRPAGSRPGGRPSGLRRSARCARPGGRGARRCRARP